MWMSRVGTICRKPTQTNIPARASLFDLLSTLLLKKSQLNDCRVTLENFMHYSLQSVKTKVEAHAPIKSEDTNWSIPALLFLRTCHKLLL